MQDNEYYNILGVSRNATQKEIKSKYRKLAFENHPDRLPDDKKEEGEKKMSEINNAYDVLSNPEKREIYDMYGKDAVNNQGRGGDPFADIFKHMNKKSKITTKVILRVKLEDIYNGKVIKQEIDRTDTCKKCCGTGFKDKIKHNCVTCNGRGITIKQTMMGPYIQQMQTTCRVCSGSGLEQNPHMVCKSCKHGLVKSKHTLNINIKKGFCEECIIIPNEGNMIPKSDERGDVLVEISVQDDKVFKRAPFGNPLDLFMELDISLLESLTGVNRVINHFNDRKISIIDTELIKEGDLKYIPSEGLSDGNNIGDLIIKYHIKYPKKIDMNTKKDIYKVLTGKDYDTNFDMSIPKGTELAYLLPFNDRSDSHDNQERGGVECVHQ